MFFGLGTEFCALAVPHRGVLVSRDVRRDVVQPPAHDAVPGVLLELGRDHHQHRRGRARQIEFTAQFGCN